MALSIFWGEASPTGQLRLHERVSLAQLYFLVQQAQATALVSRLPRGGVRDVIRPPMHPLSTAMSRVGGV